MKNFRQEQGGSHYFTFTCKCLVSQLWSEVISVVSKGNRKLFLFIEQVSNALIAESEPG